MEFGVKQEQSMKEGMERLIREVGVRWTINTRAEYTERTEACGLYLEHALWKFPISRLLVDF